MSEAPEQKNGQAIPRLWCHPKTIDTVREICSLLPAESGILDAGAGEGPLSRVLKEDGFKVKACDFDPSRFKVPDIDCVEADLDKPLPFSDGEFDAVCAVEVAEHLENISFFLKEANRVLNSSGRLIVTTPNVLNYSSRVRFLFSGFPSLFTRPLVESGSDRRHAHRRTLPYPTLRYELARAGFEIRWVTTDKFRKSSLALV
ncbi:MAG: class I SAM-dependent methyltransferase [Planctomycetota bacterium]